MADYERVRSKGKEANYIPMMPGQELKPRLSDIQRGQFNELYQQGLKNLLDDYPDLGSDLRQLFLDLSIEHLLSLPDQVSQSHFRNLVRGYLSQFRGLLEAFTDMDLRLQGAMISAHSHEEKLQQIADQPDNESLAQDLILSYAAHLEQYAKLVEPMRRLLGDLKSSLDFLRRQVEQLQVGIKQLEENSHELAVFQYDLLNDRLRPEAIDRSIQFFEQVGDRLESFKLKAAEISANVCAKCQQIEKTRQQLENRDELKQAYSELRFYQRVCQECHLASPDAIGVLTSDVFQDYLAVLEDDSLKPEAVQEAIRRLLVELTAIEQQLQQPIHLPIWDKVHDLLESKALRIQPAIEEQPAPKIVIPAAISRVRPEPKPALEATAPSQDTNSEVGQVFQLSDDPVESLMLKMGCVLAKTSTSYLRARMLHVIFRELLLKPGLLTSAEQEVYESARDLLTEQTHTLSDLENSNQLLKTTSQWFIRSSRTRGRGTNWRYACSRAGCQALRIYAGKFATSQVVAQWEAIIKERSETYGQRRQGK